MPASTDVSAQRRMGQQRAPSSKQFRFQMMIVDDAYIIVGSANINQRSMAGTRDTEMAVGCWQPAFPESNPYGEVHMFRRALWASHFMSTEQVLLYPGAIECVTRVKQMAYDNWQQYSRFV